MPLSCPGGLQRAAGPHGGGGLTELPWWAGPTGLPPLIFVALVTSTKGYRRPPSQISALEKALPEAYAL